jgi:hypothetical protein
MTLVKTRPVTLMMVSNRPKTTVALGVSRVPKVGHGVGTGVVGERNTAGITMVD